MTLRGSSRALGRALSSWPVCRNFGFLPGVQRALSWFPSLVPVWMGRGRGGLRPGSGQQPLQAPAPHLETGWPWGSGPEASRLPLLSGPVWVCCWQGFSKAPEPRWRDSRRCWWSRSPPRLPGGPPYVTDPSGPQCKPLVLPVAQVPGAVGESARGVRFSVQSGWPRGPRGGTVASSQKVSRVGVGAPGKGAGLGSQ